jgi:hypothetical protein
VVFPEKDSDSIASVYADCHTASCVGNQCGDVQKFAEAGAWECLICDRDRVRHRTVMILPFARV